MKTLVALFIISELLFLPGCAVNPVTGHQELALMSEQQEIALGRESNKQVLQQYAKYDDARLQAYVESIGKKLAAHSQRKDLVYHFTVLDSNEVNAFALPGGYIYITRGIMSYLNSEAELAAVLGHEIGHVSARHAVQQYSAAQVANIGAVLGSIFIPGMNQGGSQLMQILGTAILRGYGREDELEADGLGAEYLANSGYDPQAMIRVIKVLKSQEEFEVRAAKAEGRKPNIYHGVFATHPDNDTRLQEVVAHADKYRGESFDKPGRDVYLDMIDGLVFGESAKEGILRGRNFYHPDLGFAIHLPMHWSTHNQPNQLLVTAPGGAAILQIGVEDINKKISPREFMISRLGLRQLHDDQQLTIHEMPAHTGLASVNTSAGMREARFTVIYFNDRAYIFAGAAKQANKFKQYDPAFLETARSFHAMTENEHKLAQPLHIRIVRADDSTNFAELAKNSPLQSFAEDQLRLINAKFPNGKLKPGQLFKVIE